MSRIIIGVDAGATKTEAAAFGQSGEALAQSYGGPGNLVAAHQAAMDNILRTIRDVLPAGDAFVCVGAAGAETGHNSALLRDFLIEALPQTHVRVMSDLRLSLYAAHRGGDGMVVIAGTGSSALAKHGSDWRRAGGWGQLLGDEGSGYHIVRAAFRRVTAQYEANETYDALSNTLLQHLATDVFGAVQFFHGSSKGDIAALMPLIAQQAQAGDIAAIGLLRGAGYDLADLAIRLYRCTGFQQETQVRCIGSVLQRVDIVRQAFVGRLAEQERRIQPNLAPVYVPEGALYVYPEES